MLKRLLMKVTKKNAKADKELVKSIKKLNKKKFIKITSVVIIE